MKTHRFTHRIFWIALGASLLGALLVATPASAAGKQ